MNWKLLILACMVIGLLLVGCSSSNAPPTGYYSYGDQGAQPQGGQYVGGGCGLAADSGSAVDTLGAAAAA